MEEATRGGEMRAFTDLCKLATHVHENPRGDLDLRGVADDEEAPHVDEEGLKLLVPQHRRVHAPEAREGRKAGSGGVTTARPRRTVVGHAQYVKDTQRVLLLVQGTRDKLKPR